jgi:hypothetical integral membrane protein (TIGR02206 family)
MKWVIPQEKHDFDSFGTGHLLAIGIVVAGCVVLVMRRERLRSEERVRLITRVLTVTMVVAQCIAYWLNFFWGSIPLYMLPFHICGAVFIPVIIYAFRRYQFCAELIFFWGMLGGLMAMLMPSVDGQNFPHLVVLQTFTFHGTLLIYAVYILVVERRVFTWWSVLRVTLSTYVLAIFATIANMVIHGANYMFLAGNLEGVSTPLDLFGTGLQRYAIMAALVLLYILAEFGVAKLVQKKVS